ncbi:MAG: hypothetical protein MZV63_62300 [Marinilabiliales bacterium]|nr:hypothetical protein [Marinilabiliales bacterium]
MPPYVTGPRADENEQVILRPNLAHGEKKGVQPHENKSVKKINAEFKMLIILPTLNSICLLLKPLTYEPLIKAFFVKNGKRLLMMAIILIAPVYLFAAGGEMPSIGPVRVEFIIFGLILLGVALFHKQTFWVAVIGLTVLLTFKLIFDPGFNLLEHFFGTTPMGEQIMDKELTAG